MGDGKQWERKPLLQGGQGQPIYDTEGTTTTQDEEEYSQGKIYFPIIAVF